MLDGAIDGFGPYEDAIAAQPATPLPEDRVEGQDMLYSSGTTGRPKGVKVPLPGAPLGEGADGVTGLAQLLFGADESTPCTSPPRRCTTPPRCASARPSTASAARSS